MTSSNVEYLAAKKVDNTLISPEQTLQRVMDDLRDGKIGADNLIVLHMKDDDWGYYASNVTASEMIFMLSRMQYELHKNMD